MGFLLFRVSPSRQSAKLALFNLIGPSDLFWLSIQPYTSASTMKRETIVFCAPLPLGDSLFNLFATSDEKEKLALC